MTADRVDAWMADLLVDDARVRAPLERAWAEADGDVALQWRIATLALLAMHVEYADFRGLDAWVTRFEQGARMEPPLSRALDRARVDAAWLVLPSLDHRFEHDAAAVRAAATRLHETLRSGQLPPGDEAVLLAKALYDHASIENDLSVCERVAAVMTEHLRTGGVSATWQARWWLVLEAALAYWGPPAAAAQALGQARAQVAVDAGDNCRFALTLAQLRRAQADQDGAAVDRGLSDIEGLRPLLRPGLVLRGLHAQAEVRLGRGDHRAVLDVEDRVLALCDDVQVPERDRGLYRAHRAYALAGLQRWDEALAEFDRMRPHQKAHQARMVDVIQAVLRGVAALEQGAAEASSPVLDAVRAAASVDWRRFLLHFPHWAARLAQAGLDAGCEVEFLRQAIRERRLAPPDPWREDWPWRLRVQVLGELQIDRDGQRLSLSGKVPKKPLQLLVLLAAHPAGLEQGVLIDELWPSLEANAPRASLEMAVSRLRKLLELPDAVLAADGRLSLNPALVWSDAGAFCLLDDAAQAGAANAAADARRLYRGPLAWNPDEPAPLLHAVRARLALRYASLVLDEGQRLQATGDRAAGIRTLERALLHEPLAEPLHRALIAAQLQAGERAEALRSYRRCADLLKQSLGVEPAEETQALARQARSGP